MPDQPIGEIAQVMEDFEAARTTVPNHFISGRWRRRDGNVYARVAARGTPNAGKIDEHDPSRPV